MPEQKYLYIHKLFIQYTILLLTLFIYEIILPNKNVIYLWNQKKVVRSMHNTKIK